MKNKYSDEKDVYSLSYHISRHCDVRIVDGVHIVETVKVKTV